MPIQKSNQDRHVKTLHSDKIPDNTSNILPTFISHWSLLNLILRFYRKTFLNIKSDLENRFSKHSAAKFLKKTFSEMLNYQNLFSWLSLSRLQILTPQKYHGSLFQ